MHIKHKKQSTHWLGSLFLPTIDLAYGAELIDGRIDSAVEVLNTLIMYLPAMITTIEDTSSTQERDTLFVQIKKLDSSLLYCGTPKLAFLTKKFINKYQAAQFTKLPSLKNKIVKEAKQVLNKHATLR